ncbi:MAG: HIT domain-containing protein, partial [Actinomycetota bacterium]|nr:HIT domain-containing protein [Actinomycetota bacterium]
MGSADPDCLFCKIVAGDIPARIVAQDDRTITFMDINPATRGHALVIPRMHVRDVREIDPEDLKAVAVAAQQLAAKALERLGADGVNLLEGKPRRRCAEVGLRWRAL